MLTEKVPGGLKEVCDLELSDLLFSKASNGLRLSEKKQFARAESGPNDDPSGCKRGQIIGLGISSGARSAKNNATVPSNEKLHLLLRIGCSQNIK